MQFFKSIAVVCLLGFAVPAFAGISISAPGKANVTSPVHFTATASTSCSKGIASMGIYTVPGKLVYKVSGAKLDTYLKLNAGSYDASVKAWDKCGNAVGKKVAFNVGSALVPPIVFKDLQSKKGWSGYALLPPMFPICAKCKSAGPELKWSWTPAVTSPSMDGKTTKSWYGGGTVQWGDAFWNNHLIGTYSSHGLYDYTKTVIPSLHHFTYDVYFWVKDATISQAVEFDINQFFGGKRFIWGHECRIAGGHEWDTWNNQTKHWVKSGIPCHPISGAWNHLILDVYRTSANKLQFHSITLNGKKAILDRYDTPDKVNNWYGVTINYQIDGNINGTPYNVFLDKLTFTAQ